MLFFIKHQERILIFNIEKPAHHLIRYVPDFEFKGVSTMSLSKFRQHFSLENWNADIYHRLSIRDYDVTASWSKEDVFQTTSTHEEERLKELISKSIEYSKQQVFEDLNSNLEIQSDSIRSQLEAYTIIEYTRIVQIIGDIFENRYLTTAAPVAYYRGQSSSIWGLKPSLFRREFPSLGIKISSWEKLHKLILQTYRKRVHPYIDDKSLTDEDLLALGQHNGLPTNLLDWSTNPLIALYFACKGNAKSDGAVWILTNKRPNEDDLSKLGEELYQGNNNMYRPSIVSRFIEAQRGWFSKHLLPNDIERFEEITEISFPLDWGLIKVIIPKKIKTSLLRELKEMGIDEASVFPSIGGIARDIHDELNIISDGLYSWIMNTF